MSKRKLDPNVVELSRHLSAAVDAGNRLAAFDLADQLRMMLAADAFRPERDADGGGDATWVSVRTTQCGTVGVSPTELLMLELSEYRAGLID